MHRLVENAPSMMAYFDRDLRCRYANEAYRTWLGLDPQALIGRPLLAFLDPDQPDRNEPLVRAALAGATQQYERPFKGADGVMRHVLVVVTPDRIDGEVVGVVSHVVDVTPLKTAQLEMATVISSLEAEVKRRRDAEENLSDVQQNLSVTLDSIGSGFIATDRDGQVTAMNEAAERILGWMKDEATSRILWDVLQRDDRPREREARNPVDVMIEDDVSVATAYELTVIARDGRRVPVEVKAALTYSADGAVRGSAIIFRDLTAQKRAATERTHAEERFRMVVEAAPSGMLMVDGQGMITLANRRAEDLSGYSREELIGRPIETLVPQRAREAHPVHVGAFFAEPSARAMGAGRELFARRKDGSEVPVEIGLNPISTPDGVFTLASIIDITERKAQQDELRRSNAELEQFAYLASHDLQEPLRMVASFTELLSQRYKGQLDEKADKYIFFAVDGAKRMQSLVADLLSYSRVGSQGKPLVPVPAAAVVERVLQVLRAPIASANATVEVGALPQVLADEGQLQQLFQNLIGNAIKFRSEQPPVIKIEAKFKRTRWLFTVADNGIGIDLRYAERIFQMFQRLHERGQYEGSGIGLSIAKRILERHGGRIWLDSQPGQGTTFYFTLQPVPDDAAVGPADPEDTGDDDA